MAESPIGFDTQVDTDSRATDADRTGAVLVSVPQSTTRRYHVHRMTQIPAIQRSRALFLLLLAVLTGGCVVPREHPVTQGRLRGGQDAESSTQLDRLILARPRGQLIKQQVPVARSLSD